MNKRNGHFSRPSHLRWRSPQRSTIDPPGVSEGPIQPLRASIAATAAGSDISELVYSRPEVAVISWGGPLHVGGAAGFSSGQ